MLDALLAGIHRMLDADLVGLYLRGSLATGDFKPATSDIDALAVVERQINDCAFAALKTLHAQLDVSPNPYAGRIEIAYIDRQALKRFVPGLRHPTLGQGEALSWSQHHSNWILERWVVREHGITLLGPDPKSLIDPIPVQSLRNAVQERLDDWADWADQPDDPDWGLPLAHKAYVVETMCRALHTLAQGALSSKGQAVAWAMETLPDPWRSLVAKSRDWRTNSRVDLTVVPEVRAFVHWTHQHSKGV
jgi:hypothetical protein